MSTLAIADQLQEALALHRRGAFAEAAARYDAILKADPHNADAYHYLAMISCQHGRFAEGAELARKSLAIDGGQARVHFLLGRALAAQGRHQEALTSLDRAIALAPDLAQAHGVRANVLGDLARLEEAVAAYDRALALMPGSVEDWFNRGLALHGLGRSQDALMSFERAIAVRPEFGPAQTWRGKLLSELGRHDDALAALDRALALAPGDAEVLFARAVALNRLGRPQEALTALERALTQAPTRAALWLCRGDILVQLRQYDHAVAAYDRASGLAPELGDAWLGRGRALAGLGRHDAALAAFDRALALQPDDARAWLGRGNVCYEQSRYDEASAAFDKCMTLDPDSAAALVGMGNVAHDLRHYDDARVHYEKALAQKPDLAEAWLGLGTVCDDLNQYKAAFAHYEKALALKPDVAEAWLGRGNLLRKMERRDEALAAVDRALALKPGLAEAWVARSYVLQELNRPAEALAALDKALSIRPDLPDAISSRIYVLDFVEGAGFEEQQKARDYWWQHVGVRIAAAAPTRYANAREPGRRIKVGYLSGDFRRHSSADYFKPLLCRHDKSAFEITCYSSTLVEDDFTEDFRRASDRWRNVVQSSDDELCRQIAADEIDILVDLPGHTAGNRLGVFARKPAPVQVTAGATGTGLRTIDYLFSDPVVCPASVRHLFSEQIFDLPAIMTFEPLDDGLEIADPPVLANGYVTFAVFNRASKISDGSVALWARILEAVPQSRILFKHFAFDDAAVRHRLAERFAHHAIAGERLAYLGASARRDHLAAFNNVDISLDPFPQNGGISTLDSLQMGVPVVAKLGRSIASRAAGSILTSTGLGDWAAESDDRYLAIAVEAAARPDRLKTLRHRLPALLRASAVGNPAIFTKAVEAAYRTMWTRYCGG